MVANIVKISTRFATLSCQSEDNTVEMTVSVWFIDAIFYIYASSNPLHSPQTEWSINVKNQSTLTGTGTPMWLKIQLVRCF